MNLVSAKSGLVRYHCILVRKKAANIKKGPAKLVYCVFIVPFGLNEYILSFVVIATYLLSRFQIKFLKWSRSPPGTMPGPLEHPGLHVCLLEPEGALHWSTINSG